MKNIFFETVKGLIENDTEKFLLRKKLFWHLKNWNSNHERWPKPVKAAVHFLRPNKGIKKFSMETRGHWLDISKHMGDKIPKYWFCMALFSNHYNGHKICPFSVFRVFWNLKWFWPQKIRILIYEIGFSNMSKVKFTR
jgi:hypothetical protein